MESFKSPVGILAIVDTALVVGSYVYTSSEVDCLKNKICKIEEYICSNDPTFDVKERYNKDEKIKQLEEKIERLESIIEKMSENLSLTCEEDEEDSCDIDDIVSKIPSSLSS